MKKVLIFIIIIAIIVISIFAYKNNSKDNNIENDLILNSDGDLLLYIDEIKEEGDNLKVKGIITNGIIKVDDHISILGLGMKGIESKVIKLETKNNMVNSARAGEYICITLDSFVKKEYIKEGQAIITPKSTKPIFSIEAKIVSTEFSLEEIEEKGNNFYINSDIKCSVSIISKEEKLIKIKLEKSIVVIDKLEFIIKKDNDIMAKCSIVE